MTILRTLAQVWVALTYLVVLAINGWQAINGVNMPWSAVVTLFMLISLFLVETHLFGENIGGFVVGEQTKIAWCDHTFSPWIGCTKVSAGCANCYAEELMDKRYGRVQWGVNGTRSRTSKGNWHEPIRWNRKAEADGVRRRVFCSSLADVFEDRAELEPWRLDLLKLIEQTQSLDWLLLTKRPENVMRMIELAQDQAGAVPNAPVWLLRMAHVWIGTSVENQEQAEKRIPHLLQIPATVRFVSMEPLLGPVSLGYWIGDCLDCDAYNHREVGTINHYKSGDEDPSFHWCIVGGESGSKARPMATEWARDIRFQCKAAGIPFFMKQLGGYPNKGENLEDMPFDMRVREYPV